MALIVGQLAATLDLDKSAYEAGLNDADKKGDGLMSKIAGAGKKIGIAAGTAIAAVMTIAVVKGATRLMDIEDAQAKLTGLKMSAQDVDQVMKDALGSVKGTAFGLGDAATVAASAVAAGVKPGNDLRRTLGLVADAATQAGVPMGDMGAIFNKVAASNKVQMDVINQLTDAGVPALALIAKQLGVTSEEASKMASAGKIDFATFQSAMEQGMGGAALKSADTTRGAFANMMAALSRFGAMLLKDVFPIAKEVFGGITGWIDRVVETAGPKIEEISLKIVEWFHNAKDAVSKFLGSAKFGEMKTDTMDRLRGIAENLVKAFKDAWPALKRIFESLGKGSKGMGLSAWSTLLTTSDALSGVLAKGLAPILDTVASLLEKNPDLVTTLIGAFIAWKAATEGISTATKIAKGVQAAFNAVMHMNPISAIVIAVVALAAAVYLAYQKVGWFRDAVDAVGRWLRDTLWPILKQVGGFIGDVFVTVVKWLADVWTTKLWPALKAVGGWLRDNVWPVLRLVGEFIGAVFVANVQALSLIWSNVLWPALKAVGGFLADVVWPILQSVAGFIADYFVANVQILAWVWSNVLWPALKAVIDFIAQRVFPIISGIASAFIDAAKWVGGKIGDIVGFVTGIPGKIASTVSTLWDGIKNGISGAKDWVSDRIGDIVKLVTGIPGKLGDMSKTLLQAGKDLIQGFIDGVGAMFGKVKDKLGELTGALTSWKGPESLDRVILRPTGRIVIGGFVAGLEDQFPAVKATLGNLTSSIADMARRQVAATMGGPASPVSAAGAAGSSSVRYGDVTVNAETNASPRRIASEIGWQLKTAGV